MLIRDKRLLIISVIVLAFGLLLFVFRKDVEQIKINDAVLIAEVADDGEERKLGLGNHESLGENEGMLFVFDKPDKYAIWMQDVEFPIDVIWLNANKEVVYIENEMKPNSYPSKFRPADSALYVIEAPAGFVKENSISNGQKANW